MSTSPTDDALREHAGFLRALARSLLRNSADEDDAIQDTWATLVARPPRETPVRRAWLARVLRNAIRQRHRSESRRERREERGARPDRVLPTADLVARAEEVRLLADAVCALDERYRRAIVLRYYENLAPRSIAARLGVPVETVKSHLKRGREHLRGSLERRSPHWRDALAPFAAAAPVPSSAEPPRAPSRPMRPENALATGRPAASVVLGVVVVGLLIGGSALVAIEPTTFRLPGQEMGGAGANEELPLADRPGGERARSRDPVLVGRVRDEGEPLEGAHVGAESSTVSVPLGASADSSTARIAARFRGPGAHPEEVWLSVKSSDGDVARVRTGPATVADLPFSADTLHIDVDTVEIDGWVSDQEEVAVTRVSSDGFEALVDLPVRPRLVVRDAASEAVLDDARCHAVVTDRGSLIPAQMPAPLSFDSFLNPPPEMENGQFVLPPTTIVRDWWVGAPGHAWKRVVVAPKPEPVTVLLEPGGAVVVELTSAAPLPRHRLEMVPLRPGEFPATAMTTTLIPVGEGRFSFTGLPPGPWRITVGADGFELRALTHRDVEIIEGETAQVTIDVPAQERTLTSDLTVDVTVPEAWDLAPLWVALRGTTVAGESFSLFEKHLTGGDGRWSAAFAAVPHGVYWLGVKPYSQSRQVRLPEDAGHLHLAIPPPVSVLIDVLDATSGKSIAAAEVTTRTTFVGAGGDSHGYSKTLERSGPGQPFSTRAAAGRLGVEVRAPGYVEERMEVDLSAEDGTRRLEMALVRGAMLVVRVLRNGEVDPRAAGHVSWAATAPVPGGGRRTTVRHGRMTIEGLLPGEYVVTFVAEGSDVVHRRRVTVAAGDGRTVDFEMESD